MPSSSHTVNHLNKLKFKKFIHSFAKTCCWMWSICLEDTFGGCHLYRVLLITAQDFLKSSLKTFALLHDSLGYVANYNIYCSHSRNWFRNSDVQALCTLLQQDISIINSYVVSCKWGNPLLPHWKMNCKVMLH